MKLRNPLMIRVVALLLSWVLRLWLGSLTYRIRSDDGRALPQVKGRRGIYVFWHEVLMLPMTHLRYGFTVLASQHADGELVAQVVRMLGGGAVRGSTSRAGVSALRKLLRQGKATHLAITPDGPRGPRRVLQPGAVFLASRTGMPIVPVGIALRDCWRLRSWDRMAMAKPGTLCAVVVGQPVVVPPDLERDELDRQRDLAQAALDDAQRRAEAVAHSRCDVPAPGPSGVK